MAISKRSGTGKHKSATGKHKSQTGKHKKTTTGRVPAAGKTRSRPVGGMVPVVCSSCYEDLLYDPSVPSDSLNCPFCDHAAARPDDATLHRIGEKHRQEKNAFRLTAILTGVGLVSFIGWLKLMGNPANVEDSAIFWGPIGVSGLCALLLVIFIVKYEGNRWEAYF